MEVGELIGSGGGCIFVCFIATTVSLSVKSESWVQFKLLFDLSKGPTEVLIPGVNVCVSVLRCELFGRLM